MHHPQFRLGLRTVKTALSVMLSLYLASVFGELSIFPALASIGVMSRTFDEGLRECRNQAVGIAIGGAFGCLAALALPEPPIWVIALGVMVIIVLCASFHVGYSSSLSCAIFIVACMSEPSEVVHSVLIRLFHTAIGLGTGLLINYLILPYDNSRKIYGLLEAFLRQIPAELDALFSRQSGLSASRADALQQLDYELSIFRHQRFRRKGQHRMTYMHMTGCAQTAELLHQELTVLRHMSRLGPPNGDNLVKLQCMGLTPAQWDFSATEEETTVTNYHLRRLLEHYTQLKRLLENGLE